MTEGIGEKPALDMRSPETVGAGTREFQNAACRITSANNCLEGSRAPCSVDIPQQRRSTTQEFALQVTSTLREVRWHGRWHVDIDSPPSPGGGEEGEQRAFSPPS